MSCWQKVGFTHTIMKCHKVMRRYHCGNLPSANLYARIEPDVKEKAESILSTLGIPASSAINMFYKQIILQRGLPFEVKIPSARPVDISTLSEAEFNEELEKGYADMQAGRTKNAKKAFTDIRKDYGL